MNKKVLSRDKILVIVTGAVIALAAFILTRLGNPKNMGFCIACFIRDMAGGMKFHNAAVVQYMRPEIIGLVLGSFIVALIRGEFKPKSGSSPLTRFVLGAIVMICALVFLGCPLRMFIRLGGGDMNAIIALLGFVAGIYIGTLYLKKGYSLGRAEKKHLVEGGIAPALQILLLILVIAVPGLFIISQKGPGSMHAPLVASLLIAAVVGALCQLSRLCTAGGIRDLFLTKDVTLVLGPIALVVVLTILNLATGSYNFGFKGQPIAHSDHIWNFLSFTAVGLGSVMLGGCPLRQLILAGEGNGDSFISVLGMFMGAAISHNFGLAGVAASASSQGGATLGGKIAVILSLIFLVLHGIYIAKKNQRG